ncbi:Biotin--protein ligase [Devosia sp. H5989]|nr:Biotin--protein ligase [Devosia sp. H5989]
MSRPFRLGAKASLAGYRLRGFDTVGSTNTEAMKAAQGGDGGPIWFAALQQTDGRGRRGRPWVSPHGNLAASLLIVPDVDPTFAATLGFVAGVALNCALAAVLPQGKFKTGLDGADGDEGGKRARIALKWPNDVLADGAKLSGILLEAQKLADSRTAIVMGCGVNVVAAPEGTPYPATSLRDLGADVDAQAVFEALTQAWVDTYALWDQGRGIPEVLRQWRDFAAGIGAPVAVSRHGDIVRGIFETIDDAGRLVVRADDDTRIAITAGDVHFGTTASVAP